MNWKVSQQRSDLISGGFTAKFSQNELQSSKQWSSLVRSFFTAKVSINELQSFAAKVRSDQWRPHRKTFTKRIAKFRSKGPVFSVDASPKKVHKINWKVSKQRSGLVSGSLTAKVSQKEWKRFAAKVRSS